LLLQQERKIGDQTSAMAGNRTWMILLLLSLILPRSSGEVRKFVGMIEAASTYIHYSEGYLVAPGSVDLRNLDFLALPKPIPGTSGEKTTEKGETNDKETKTGGNETGGGDRRLSDGGLKSSAIDIALFHEPKRCSNTKDGCDWTELGIGASNDNGLRWCCSNDAIDFGFCQGGPNEYGRLIINSTSFMGKHRFIMVPAEGDMDPHVRYGKIDGLQESGKYVLVIANCNEEGRDVLVSGKYTWESKHGFLPGEIFGEMYFFISLTVIYLILLLWYGFSMRLYDDATIPIQKWILGTIILGLLETFFRTGDYLVWNEDGSRFWFALYSGVILGVLKRGISRCLIVMVSLGWGVVRDTLSQLQVIIALGVTYVGAACALDVMDSLSVTENETLDINKSSKLDPFTVAVLAVAFTVALINVIFYLWILDAMGGTMQYLENMNQNMKLLRYLRLRCLLLFSILFAVVWFIFSIVNAKQSILEEQQEWSIDALMELNYLMLLIGVAILWRPNPNAKEFAYVIELPAAGGEGEENELEMTSTVPSALDDDDDEETENGFKENAASRKLEGDNCDIANE